MPQPPPPENPWLATRTRTGAEYDAPYTARAAAGENVHGEADFLCALLQATTPSGPGKLHVLDVGCGTGRIGIELARRGHAVVGVDLDEVMLTQARVNAPRLDWRLGDLATIALEQRFDAALLDGNVMIYLTPGTEAATLANIARHLKPNGLLVVAFEQPAPAWSGLTVARYDQLAAAAGLKHIERWSTWGRDAWHPGDRYALSVHQKQTASPRGWANRRASPHPRHFQQARDHGV
jgi:SAM-dependent methyltransferase